MLRSTRGAWAGYSAVRTSEGAPHPETAILRSHRREYLKSYIALNGWAL
jgi:hypothetical protein